MVTSVLNILTFFLLCILYGTAIANVRINYYWREYTGIIPKDAVPGGYDLNNETTYIGQGYVKDVGLIPGVIYPGKKSIVVPLGAPATVDSHVKILCSPHLHAFKWIPCKADQFHVITINKHLVPGGIEYNNYTINIGRIASDGEVIIGKVISGSPNTPGLAPMYYVRKGSERRIDYYEILTYDPRLNFLLDERLGVEET